jgi:hypothetical protein
MGNGRGDKKARDEAEISTDEEESVWTAIG